MDVDKHEHKHEHEKDEEPELERDKVDVDSVDSVGRMKRGPLLGGKYDLEVGKLK